MSGAAVEVDRLVVKFGRFTAVNDVSFKVLPGEIFGFLGANGAGKTTTIRVLCGLLRPTSGQVRVAGFDADGDLRPIRQKVGYMSQKFTLYDDLTVEQNLAFAASLRRMDAATLALRSKVLLNVIGFDEPVTTLVRDLPGGFRQEVSLAAAMLHDPDLIFLDEPTAGVSPAARLRFWGLIGRVAAEGKTVFVTTHYMDEAEQCGRIALMREGRLIALGSPDELKEKAFRKPLYELHAEPGVGKEWLQAVRADPSVYDLNPHGLRWHLSVRDEAGFQRLLGRLGPKIASRRIAPTLHDVFIRIVEAGAL